MTDLQLQQLRALTKPGCLAGEFAMALRLLIEIVAHEQNLPNVAPVVSPNTGPTLADGEGFSA